jgi:hypothetical protein
MKYVLHNCDIPYVVDISGNVPEAMVKRMFGKQAIALGIKRMVAGGDEVYCCDEQLTIASKTGYVLGRAVLHTNTFDLLKFATDNARRQAEGVVP